MRYIQVPALILVIVLLYAFSAKRNAARKLGTVQVEYTNGNRLFITDKTVNNLLKINWNEAKKHPKDSLNLDILEDRLNQNPMIADAEVYESVTGHLGVLITQRQPVARVVGANAFYIDKDGETMPLSSNFSARVPLVSGVDTTTISEVFPLIQKIRHDNFLTRHVTGIKRLKDGDYILELRESPMTIIFGKISRIDQKVRNFKAFYKKIYIEHKLGMYSKANLKFVNQVVCTKKEA